MNGPKVDSSSERHKIHMFKGTYPVAREVEHASICLYKGFKMSCQRPSGHSSLHKYILLDVGQHECPSPSKYILEHHSKQKSVRDIAVM